ncbi:hypothetical protein AB0O01_36380 [Streptomyces sp. NPDC093252]|uniref:hypothetical protein n=1 Tax=Streptomyces sp. NPDC093252 TaxID=3154980 RepID=UPI00342F81F2
MSTPLQASTTEIYQGAISLLEGAKGNLSSSQGRVRDMASQLGVDYGGADGKMFQQVLEKWLGEVDQIKFTCDRMIEQLSTSMTTSGNAQGDAEGLVQQLGSLSARDDAFNTLTT